MKRMNGIFNCLVITVLLVSFLFFQVIDSSSGSRYKIDTKITRADSIFIGGEVNDFFGYAVSCAGDVNGDGIDDILIGAYGNNTGGNDAGETYLFFGNRCEGLNNISLSEADASFIGESPGDWSGFSVSSGGDINGDGYDDILIGAQHNSEVGSETGQTYLIFGKEDGWELNMNLSHSDASFLGEFPEDRSGSSVSSAGDINRDGFNDILIGSPGNDQGGIMAGKTYLIFGKESGWSMDTYLDSADASFFGSRNYDSSGISISIEGDVNGDGYHDILIFGWGSGNGTTNLIFGRTSGLGKDFNLSSADASFVGETGLDRSGISISSGGDVNGDGFDDILIGSDLNSEGGTGAGQSYLIMGRDQGWSKGVSLSNSDASFIGESILDYSGSKVSIIGDVNGDGFDDILINSPNNGEGGTGAGQAYLIFGKRSGWSMDNLLSDADVSFQGENNYDHLSFSLCGSGDVNGDGFDDILIGASYGGPSHDKSGRAYLIHIKTRPSPPEKVWTELSENGSYLKISWNASFYIDNISGYRVYRSENGIDYPLIARTNSDTLYYIDKDVVIGRYYHYKVTAIGVPNMESFNSKGVSIMNDLDTDSDWIGNSVDDDDDNDGYPDVIDPFPLNPLEWLDTDNDGLGNQLDNDDDNDGLPDAIDPDPLSSIITMMKYMGAMNMTIEQINVEISQIRIELENFLNSVYGSLQTIRDNLDSYGVNISLDMDDLMLFVEEMEPGILENLSSKLNDLSVKVGENNTQIRNDLLDLKGSVDEFNEKMMNSISFLSAKVATSEDAETIKDNIDRVETELEKLDGLDEEISDLDRGQEDIEGRIAGLRIHIWILIIFLIILAVVIVGIVLKVEFMKQEDSWNIEDDDEW